MECRISGARSPPESRRSRRAICAEPHVRPQTTGSRASREQAMTSRQALGETACLVCSRGGGAGGARHRACHSSRDGISGRRSQSREADDRRIEKSREQQGRVYLGPAPIHGVPRTSPRAGGTSGVQRADCRLLPCRGVLIRALLRSPTSSDCWLGLYHVRRSTRRRVRWGWSGGWGWGLVRCALGPGAVAHTERVARACKRVLIELVASPLDDRSAHRRYDVVPALWLSSRREHAACWELRV